MNFLASLIAGPSAEKVEVQRNAGVMEGKLKEKEQKKSYMHGINVLFTTGIYKGYHGFVADFYPATYTLSTTGKGMIEAEKYENEDIGSTIMTDFGESKIEKIILPSWKRSIVKLVVYNEGDVLKVGRVLDNKLDAQLIFNKGTQAELANPNNVFVIDLPVFDASFVSAMDKMNLNSSDIVQEMNRMHINDESVPAPIQVIKQLSKQVKQDTSGEIFDKLVLPDRIAALSKMEVDKDETRVNQDQLNKMVMQLAENVTIKTLNVKDIVGSVYYMDVSKQSLGSFTEYNPNKKQYYISYKKTVGFKPSMLEIQADKRFARVKKWKQVFRIKSYNHAKLSVTLATNGKTVAEHIDQKKDKQGKVVRNGDEIIFESRPIYPSDVFYIDVTLKSGNKAQIVKLLADGTIEVIEQEGGAFTKKTIKETDITVLEPGFSFQNKALMPSQDEESVIGGRVIYKRDKEEDLEEQYDDEFNEDAQEHDYGDDEIVAEIDENEPKTSFKDTERTVIVHEELTGKQLQLKSEVAEVIKLLGLSEDMINIYETASTIMEVINHLSKELRVIQYNHDLSVTRDVKFIVVCVVLYDLLNVGYTVGWDMILAKLFPTYFKVKDISASNLNDTIFLKTWYNLSDERIKSSVARISEYRKRDNIEVLKVLLSNCDMILQSVLGLRVNIDMTPASEGEVIALGINTDTGRRWKVEKEEAALANKKLYQNYAIPVKDILQDDIPINEVAILWGDNIAVLESFRKALTLKYEQQNNKGYLYIRDNLHRAPFALREEMTLPIRKMFQSTYASLQGKVIERQVQLQRNQNKKREAHDELLQRRKKIYMDIELEQDELQQLPNTKKYEQERKRRELQKSLQRNSRLARTNNKE